MSIRKRIIAVLEENVLNALEISQELSIREKEVYEHLPHIQKSLLAQGRKLTLTPYRCKGCDYEFTDRSRWDRPGRCPLCKGGHIAMATYWIPS